MDIPRKLRYERSKNGATGYARRHAQIALTPVRRFLADRSAVTVVVSNYDNEHQVVWLSVGNRAAQWGGAHVCVRYANGEGFSLAKC